MPRDEVADNADYEAEYDADFVDFIQSLGLPERLPPLWLPPLADQAAAARDSALLRRVGALVEWVGERRPVTEDEDLTEADAAEAAALLGVTDVELLLCWEVALATDLVVVSDGNADANPDLWPTGDDEEDVGTWAIAFTQVLQSLVIDTDLAGEEDLALDGAGALMLPLFLSRSLGAPVAELREMAFEVATEHLDEEDALAAWDAWVADHGDPVTELLDRLVAHGAVEPAEEIVRLTPLAMLVMREELVDGGLEIPLLPPLPEMTAADLLTAVGGVTVDELADLSRGWLAARDEETAAAELLSAAATATPAGRVYATNLLADLPATRWAAALDEPALRPYALGVLDRPQEPADLAWLLLDGLAASADILGELDPDAVEDVTAVALPEGREEEVLSGAWRLPHPHAHAALALVGAHHPDKRIAKTARAAAHKVRSAG